MAFWKNISGSTVDSANNLSDDTANATYNAKDMGQGIDDTTALIGKSAAQIDFVSTTGGSEDLHIDTDSVCIGAGVDVGSVSGINIDIDEETMSGDRSIGADFVSADTGSPAFLIFLS